MDDSVILVKSVNENALNELFSLKILSAITHFYCITVLYL